jgi:hypothetical protein
MATQGLAGIDALLKNVYKGPLVEEFNNETQILDILEKTNANDMGTFTGRQLIFPVHSSRNRGRGALSATTGTGQLPAAGTQGTVDGTVTMTYFAGGIELDDVAIRQSKTDVGSFVRALTFEMDSCKADLRKDVTRIAYGTGDGLLATVTGTPAGGTSITVDSGQYIAVGDTVDIIVKTSGATTNGVLATLVTAVTYTGTANSSTQAAATLTIGTTTAGATSNLYGVYLSGDRSNESDGLRNICSTSRTLHNINSASAGNGFWDSNVKDFANANPSEDGIMALAQTIRQRSSSTKPDFGMFSLGAQRRLANTYGSQKRWNDKNTTDITGGYEAIMVSAGGAPIPVMADVDCPNGTGFLINKSSFAWSELSSPDWLEAPDGVGGILYLKDGAALGTKSRTWQGWLVWDARLICVAPNRNGKFINMNDDIPVARI